MEQKKHSLNFVYNEISKKKNVYINFIFIYLLYILKVEKIIQYSSNFILYVCMYTLLYLPKTIANRY